MSPCPPVTLQRRVRRRPWFWLLVASSTVFMTLEPSLFLVIVALALSLLALCWIVLLVRLLVSDALAYAIRYLSGSRTTT